MTPDEFRQTQQGGRWYQLWLRERNPLRKEEYQRMFNEVLKKINGEIMDIKSPSKCATCKHFGDRNYCSNCHSDHSLFEEIDMRKGEEE